MKGERKKVPVDRKPELYVIKYRDDRKGQKYMANFFIIRQQHPTRVIVVVRFLCLLLKIIILFYCDVLNERCDNTMPSCGER